MPDPRACGVCQSVFVPSKHFKRYCSLACRQAGYARSVRAGVDRYQAKKRALRATTGRAPFSLADWSRDRKLELLDAVGSRCCQRCGYDECSAALDVHHRDPAKKETSIIRQSKATWIGLEGCAVLCANCHRLVHYTADSEWLDG